MKGEIPSVLVSSGSTEGALELRTGEIIAVGSDCWFDWVRVNDSFRFESGFAGQDSFTARKHERHAGEFWYAYRKVDGKLKNAYLGKGERLTIDRMLEIASKLIETPKSAANKTRLGKGYATECITEQLGNEQVDDFKANELTQKLQDELVALQAENEQLRSRLTESELLAVEWQQKLQGLKSLLEKINAKQTGYKSNGFGQGLKDLKDLI
jgi:hypothetical protein